MPNFNEQAWLEGFIAETMAMGLDKQAAYELLKTAVRRELVAENPAFAEGFNAEMQKQAANWLPLLAALGVGGAGTLGLRELFNQARMHWNRSPGQQQRMAGYEQSKWSADPDELFARMAHGAAQEWADKGRLYGGTGFSPMSNPAAWGNLMYGRPYQGFTLGW